MGPKGLSRRQASPGAGQRARTAGWGISGPSWGGHPTLVPLLTPTPQFGKTRIPVGDGAQPCRALERPLGREWAAGANRGTRTSACPDIAPLACTPAHREPARKSVQVWDGAHVQTLQLATTPIWRTFQRQDWG